MYHLSSVVVEDIYIFFHGPHRSPWKGTPSSFKKLQAALCQGFRDDQSRTLQDLLLRVDVVVPPRRCYKFDIKFNFSGFRSRTFILFNFTLHRQLVC